MTMFTSPQQSAAVETGAQWRRLSPVAIVYFLGSQLRNFASGLIYIVPAAAVGANKLDFIHSGWFVPGLAAVIIFMLASALTSYFFYFFRIHQQHVEIRSGVFQRKQLNLPFWRIQNVKIEQPFYFRPFDFAVLILDTAGSKDEEGRLVALPLHYAQSLRQQILLQTAEAESTSEDVPSPAMSNEQLINTRSVGDLIIHGITNNRVWILLGAAAPFFDSISNSVVNWLASQGINLKHIFDDQTLAWWQFGLYALTLLLVIMALLASLSVAGSLLTYYGYTLVKVDDRYIRRSGLLSKQEVSMRQSRVQLVSIKQDWLDKVLGRANVFFEQNTSGEPQANELMAANKLLVPSVTEPEAQALSEDVFAGNSLYNTPFTPVSRHFLWHNLLVKLFPVVLLLLVITLFSQRWQAAALVSSVALVVAAIMALRWWRWGVASDNEYIYIRRGYIGIDYACFPLDKVQQVTIKQSILMKRRGLASVQFVLASGRETVPFLPEALAYALANYSLYRVEKWQRSWM